MDMDRDLKDMDLEAERPTQPLGDGDVSKWVTPNSPTVPKKQKLARVEPLSFSQSKKDGGR